MLINNWKDLEGFVRFRVYNNTPDYIIEKIVDSIDKDPNRPSFKENWRSYLDSLPQNLTSIIVY